MGFERRCSRRALRVSSPSPLLLSSLHRCEVVSGPHAALPRLPTPPNTQSLGSDPTFSIQIRGLTVLPSSPPPSFSVHVAGRGVRISPPAPCPAPGTDSLPSSPHPLLLPRASINDYFWGIQRGTPLVTTLNI